MRPDRLKEPMLSATTLSGCRRPHTTLGQLQKWLEEFHEPSKLGGLEDTMDLKERSVSSSVELVVLPRDTRAREKGHNSRKTQSNFIALAMRKVVATGDALGCCWSIGCYK